LPRILYIGHYFPPLGGAGVQRTVKFIKYLPDAGFQPVVVTGSGSESGWWSPSDTSMLNEIPESVRVFRTPAASAGELTAAMTAPRVEAIRKLSERAARETAAELVFVSMSPFPDARVASTISRRLRIPWVADLRDPWALDEFQVYPSSLHRLADKREMASALSTASLIVMNTPEAAARLTALPGFRRKKIVSVTNGYDAEDFAGGTSSGSQKVFTIVHAGHLHTVAGLHQRRHALRYRLLGKTEPGVQILTRSHYYLLQAIELWLTEHPAVRDKLAVVLVGKPSAADLEIVTASPAGSVVKFTGYVSHAQSVQQIRMANLLFLPMHKMPPGRRATIVPGKAYEYMATGLPILAALPDGDAREFLRDAGTGLSCEPDDVGAMSAILKAQFQAWSDGRVTTTPDRRFVERFERRRLTKQLATELLAL
jgi:glycosyltransferase involved in cell wall biosynthesis